MGNQAKRRQKNRQQGNKPQNQNNGQGKNTPHRNGQRQIPKGEEYTPNYEENLDQDGYAEGDYSKDSFGNQYYEDGYDDSYDSDTASFEPQAEGGDTSTFATGEDYQEEDFSVDYQPDPYQPMDEPWDETEEGDSVENMPPVRNDVILCEHCGEEFSVTYKRCPFCDERQTGGRSGEAGPKSYSMDPRHIVGFTISMVLICTAGFIVLKQVRPLLGPQESSKSETKEPSENSEDGSMLDDVVIPDVTPEDQPTIPEDLTDLENMQPEPSLDMDPVSTVSTIVGASGGLNVRSGAGTNYNVQDSLKNGDQITVLTSAGNGWYQITYQASGGAKTGYIMGDYISPSPSADSTPTPTPTPEVTTPTTTTPTTTPSTSTGNLGTGAAVISGASGGVRVRGGPGTSHEVLATAYNDSEITVVSQSTDGWYQITFTGNNGKQTGYILGDYITMK